MWPVFLRWCWMGNRFRHQPRHLWKRQCSLSRWSTFTSDGLVVAASFTLWMPSWVTGPVLLEVDAYAGADNLLGTQYYYMVFWTSWKTPTSLPFGSIFPWRDYAEISIIKLLAVVSECIVFSFNFFRMSSGFEIVWLQWPILNCHSCNRL